MAPAIFRQSTIIDCIQRVYNLSPSAKYVGYFDFGSPTTMIRDPELIKSIAIKNFDHFVNHRGFVNEDLEPLFAGALFSLHDDRWREIRNILTPAFSSSKMKAMFKLMSTCAENFASYLEETSRDKPSEINSKDAFCRLTNDIIATCAFGISINSMKDQNNTFYTLGRKATSFEGFRAFKFFFVRSFPRFSKLFKIRIIEKNVDNFFTNLVEETIKERDEKGITRPDMIQLMMETRGNDKSKTTLSIVEMTSQAFVFFLAGFDTTATMMCFIAHEIAADANIQKRLQNEIDELLEKNNGQVTYEGVNKLQYLDAVINETLRFYPIAPFLDRVCSKSFELPPALPGMKPLTLKPGDFVWFPVYPIQHDDKYFDEPDKFNPDRFIDDPKCNVNLPTTFGLGPRMCIGNRFALLEMKVMLVHLISRCQLKPAEKMITPIEICKKSMAMTAKGGFWLEIQPRNKFINNSNSDI